MAERPASRHELARLDRIRGAIVCHDGRLLTKQTAADLRHTLRTPINHISGYTDILLEDLEGKPEAAEAIKLLNDIRESARRNLEAIQNVLSGESDGLHSSALTELQRRMSQPIERMGMAAEVLENILPQPMLADLARIDGLRHPALEFRQRARVQ